MKLSVVVFRWMFEKKEKDRNKPADSLLFNKTRRIQSSPTGWTTVDHDYLLTTESPVTFTQRHGDGAFCKQSRSSPYSLRKPSELISVVCWRICVGTDTLTYLSCLKSIMQKPFFLFSDPLERIAVLHVIACWKKKHHWSSLDASDVQQNFIRSTSHIADYLSLTSTCDRWSPSVYVPLIMRRKRTSVRHRSQTNWILWSNNNHLLHSHTHTYLNTAAHVDPF